MHTGDPEYGSFSLVVGEGSCIGKRSCYQYEGGSFDVGIKSCKGNYACSTDNKDEKITIGNGSCNCPHCCSCLEGGDIVPDDSCNALAEDQCCKKKGKKGTKLLVPSMSPSLNPFSVPLSKPILPPSAKSSGGASKQFDDII